MSWKMRAVLAANMFTCNFYDVRFPVFFGVWMMPYMPFFWRFPGHENTHMAYRKKYKPYILKYKALISKYMPYIFRLFKHLNHKDLQKGQKWRQKHERQRGVLERLLTVFCYAGRGVFLCARCRDFAGTGGKQKRRYHDFQAAWYLPFRTRYITIKS